ncbi:glycan-binding surface protein [Mucilaginibacter paludis]|uniref:Cell surface receptor IPT/TIG domain protein n=1 Tax=Mucilaginibacter paludis DSM 18603 TaxID=714943 RepID=H1YA97_9SPHI|nr:glycan-binding surface protein [Mucilaginibacter paludis]EHQ25978.1 cell surface receptor IPT/TIG domain protein [Mucilaginibacter paludis DSM 18603]
MKRNLYLRLYFVPLFFVMVALLSACKKNADNAPIISGVRSYVASPNDTVLHSAVASGQWVVITGQNLQNATQIKFDGVPAAFNSALFASNSAVVQIPAIQFSTIDTAKLYTIQYVTPAGSATFSFKLGPAGPTISAISNVFANPGDSVYVYGANLVLVQRFSYGGTVISSFKPSLDGTSIGFLMPAQTTTDQVTVIAKAGSVNFKILAIPTITAVSNENASPGDSVYIYGTNLKNIQTLTFAGTAVTSFTSSGSGNALGFVLPALTKSAPVSVTTKFGTATTVYNVNDVATGRISDWEWGGNFNWQWWGGSYYTSGSADFPGNSSQYMVLKTSSLIGGEGNTYSNYAILMNAAQWVPTANLNDPVDNWAFKFEVSVPKPWNGGTIDILSGVSSSPIARWEPWQVSASATASYTTNKWVTVTIPLSSFRAKDATLGEGKGASITKIADLTGPTGNTACTVYIHNYSTAATATGFYGAFDNFRVVKIK